MLAGYSSHVVHPLKTIWVESHQVLSPTSSSGSDSKPIPDAKDLELNLVLPEETLVLAANDYESKNEWLLQLQRCIIDSLAVNQGATNPSHDAVVKIYTPPITRNTNYTFTKIADMKGAEYHGMWLYGKLHGQGKLTWPGGRSYFGQFRQNQKHGMGKICFSNGDVYDGQWSGDKFEGRGKICFSNGDVYRGTVKDGKPHGHGMLKQGRFMGSGASVYNGEWSLGVKCGYGVMDDIISGEKYMGMWNNDMKNGPGCAVTLDGVYYEGTFSHNKMSGKGLMMFEDETIYEGHFADVGVFSGAGALKYANGDRLEGSFYGNFKDGMKFNGTVYKIGE